MRHVLICGIGPYLTEPGMAASGPTIRVRQFAEPLVAAGHAVSLLMLEGRVRESVSLPGMARAVALTPREILDPAGVVRRFPGPPIDAVFGVGSMMPVAAAARLAAHLRKPCWLDFFGDPLAEFHAGTSRPQVKLDLVLRDHIWRFVREGLNAGDRFSAVSDRQRAALLGQLILTGRATEGLSPLSRIHTIPCGVPAAWAQSADDPPFPQALSDYGLTPASKFVYVGGSWTPWMDEDRMGWMLGHLLGSEEGVELVVRGGPAQALAGRIRQSFFGKIESLAPAGSVHELTNDDPVSENEILAYASATLLLDRDIPESHLGARNRLLAFLRWGLMPVVSTHSEIARDLVARGLAIEALPTDVPRLAVQPLRQSLHRMTGERRELRRRGMDYLKSVTFDATMAPVLQWLETVDRWPAPAGDQSGALITKWRDGGL